MRLLLLLVVPVVVYALASMAICIAVPRRPAGMPRLVRAVVSTAVWWALGARRPKARHATPTRKEQRHV